MFGHAEWAGGHCRAAMFFVLIRMLGKSNAMLAQELGGGCLGDVLFLGHACYAKDEQ